MTATKPHFVCRLLGVKHPVTGFDIDWRRDFGIDRRSGWSIKVDGVFLTTMERHLVVALWLAWRKYKTIDWEEVDG